MKKTLEIEGMMCTHCEKHVKNALESLEGVSIAQVSYQSGTAIVTLEREVPDEILKKAVTDEGYAVVSIH